MAAEKLPENITNALYDAKQQLNRLFPGQVRDIILFGSYARGDFSYGSDIDLLLLLDPQVADSTDREHYLPAIADLSLKHDTVLSVVPMSIDAFRTKKTPLILNIKKEGRSL